LGNPGTGSSKKTSLWRPRSGKTLELRWARSDGKRAHSVLRGASLSPTAVWPRPPAPPSGYLVRSFGNSMERKARQECAAVLGQVHFQDGIL
jgi:hypothetical protein